jgi:hypothetical protein
VKRRKCGMLEEDESGDIKDAKKVGEEYKS